MSFSVSSNFEPIIIIDNLYPITMYFAVSLRTTPYKIPHCAEPELYLPTITTKSLITSHLEMVVFSSFHSANMYQVLLKDRLFFPGKAPTVKTCSRYIKSQ